MRIRPCSWFIIKKCLDRMVLKLGRNKSITYEKFNILWLRALQKICFYDHSFKHKKYLHY